jgi:hypothetical protein
LFLLFQVFVAVVAPLNLHQGAEEVRCRKVMVAISHRHWRTHATAPQFRNIAAVGAAPQRRRGGASEESRQ